jgi:hypothetical protein
MQYTEERLPQGLHQAVETFALLPRRIDNKTKVWLEWVTDVWVFHRGFSEGDDGWHLKQTYAGRVSSSLNKQWDGFGWKHL